MTRLIVHVGTRKTATTYIQGSLHLNEPRLADEGIYIPRAGRSSLTANTINHHQLAWQLGADPRFDERSGGWREVASEIDDRRPPVALLSSEVLEDVFLSHDQTCRFSDQLRAMADDVTIVVVMRDWLEYINSVYTQYVKMLTSVTSFENFVIDQTLGTGLGNVFDNFRPMIEDERIGFAATTYESVIDGDLLSNLLRTCGIAPRPDLDAPSDHLNRSLGTVGVAITHELRRRLEDEDPEFRWHKPAVLQLHRVSAQRLRRRGLDGEPFWGFHPELAGRVAATVRPQLDAFARAVWETSWPGDLRIDRPRSTVELDDFGPELARAAAGHIHDMLRRYEALSAQLA